MTEIELSSSCPTVCHTMHHISPFMLNVGVSLSDLSLKVVTECHVFVSGVGVGVTDGVGVGAAPEIV